MMRITLNGDLGSGKSTIGRRLSARLNIPYISGGQIFREIGQISNMDALQTNLAAEDNSNIDFLVDERLRELDQSSGDFIIDSRLAWHFVHDAIRVFLSVCPETAASRIMSDTSRSSESYPDKGTAMASLKRRRDSENKRYRKLYGVDIDDMSNYDLVIITDDADVDDVVTLIVEFLLRNRTHKLWIPKTRLVPMISIRDASGVAFSTRFNLTDKFSLCLCVENNFGFYFEGAVNLINAFSYVLSLIPYSMDTPSFLPDGCNVGDLAKRTLKISDLYDWEELGRVELAFAKKFESSISVESN